MISRILLDSNIIIEVLNGTVAPAQLFRGESLLSISVVTVMEMYALAGMSAGEQERIDERNHRTEACFIAFIIGL